MNPDCYSNFQQLPLALFVGRVLRLLLLCAGHRRHLHLHLASQGSQRQASLAGSAAPIVGRQLARPIKC